MSENTILPDDLIFGSMTVFLSNYWKDDVDSVIIRHRRANDSSKEEHMRLDNVGMFEAHRFVMNIVYDVSFFFPDFDYWWIMLTTKNLRVYTIKSNFYCNISPNDNGDVLLTLSSDTMYLYVELSYSTNCLQSIYEL
ncbi:hypothetical protein [Xenorhabdus griffiniae]|uniref:hypothetical protein n=1 Tax=Xenorhabdus griffiniae TaxID=351672 RepID=UPI0023584147|nr:hypothetical protein [Xenorhabdus griffiniae]MDC9606608.1 hypothetical protein [Xenorhabdus griffiniae]